MNAPLAVLALLLCLLPGGRDMSERSKVDVLPKQLVFLRAAAREVLYSGSFRGGKTRGLCLKAAMRAAHPGAREGLCRKALVALRATTLRTLLEPEGDLPPVLPSGSYEHLKTERRIRLRGGGEIYYFGLDVPEKIGSLGLSGCGVDEAVELTEQDWTWLRGRLSLQAGIPNQLYAACNPSGPQHFLARRFGLAGGRPPAPGCAAITTRSRDNTFLPADYLADLDCFTGIAKARYVEGLWAASDRLVYDSWSSEAFVRSRNPKEIIRWGLGIDQGYRNPSAILLGGVDGDGRLHFHREWYQRGKLPAEIVAASAEFGAHFDLERVLVDPSAAALIAELLDAGLPAEGAVNDVLPGIACVRSGLRVDGDGQPRLTVDPSCENLRREFESYETKDDKGRGGSRLDEPMKQNDHAVDAARYLAMYFSGGLADVGERWSPGEREPAPVDAATIRDELAAEEKDAAFTWGPREEEP